MPFTRAEIENVMAHARYRLPRPHLVLRAGVWWCSGAHSVERYAHTSVSGITPQRAYAHWILSGNKTVDRITDQEVAAIVKGAREWWRAKRGG